MHAKSISIVSLYLLCLSIANSQEELLNLPIGDPARADRETSVRVDAITDTSRDELILPQTLTAQIRGNRVVLVGEEHTGHEFHAVQLRVLELLHAANVELAVGLEMFPVDRQAALDAWIGGDLDEQAFIDTADWYRVWGYHWGYYREIFLFAREHAIPMIALREPVDEHAGSAAEELPVAPASEDHMALVQAFFETDSPVHGGLSPEQLDALVAAQSARDAAMASQIAAALREYPNRTVVVLAGTGHVLYELGIVRQLPETDRRSAVSILPVEVEDAETFVRASVGDYVWGIPELPYPRFPELGVITMQVDDGLQVIYVESDSPAGEAGVETGDVLTALNGNALTEKRDLGQAVAAAAWGDAAAITLKRDGAAQQLTVLFRR
ncbi:MAG: ChaN family lipoprotein [Gammaproteobacteria bacterium]|nr:ChaN family lipoprotein [Gammaproteobacteria bacterium]